MKAYEPATPRAALGLAAVAMAAITMGVFVVLPAKFDSLGADPYTLAAAKAATKTPFEVVINPARTDAPKVVDREAYDRPGHTALGAQEFLGQRGRSISRSRNNT
jgi:hypothetical protein